MTIYMFVYIYKISNEGIFTKLHVYFKNEFVIDIENKQNEIW